MWRIVLTPILALCAIAAYGAPNPYGPPSPARAIHSLSKYGISRKSVMALSHRRADERTRQWIQRSTHSRMQAVKHMFGKRDALLRTFTRAPSAKEHSTGWVYYFVSSSMPQSLLRAYAHDSMWSGGVLVFRGVVAHHSIVWFMHHVVGPLMKNPLARPVVVIDPRLYQVFNVRSVPVIVYSAIAPETLCARSTLSALSTALAPRSRTCVGANPAQYWKVEGTVSSVWALRAFKHAGALGLDPLLHIEHLRPGSHTVARRIVALSAKGYINIPTPASILDAAASIGTARGRTQGANIAWWQKEGDFLAKPLSRNQPGASQ